MIQNFRANDTNIFGQTPWGQVIHHLLNIHTGHGAALRTGEGERAASLVNSSPDREDTGEEELASPPVLSPLRPLSTSPIPQVDGINVDHAEDSDSEEDGDSEEDENSLNLYYDSNIYDILVNYP